MKRKLIAIAVIAGTCLGVVVTRAVWEGRSALRRGSEAASAGDMRAAVTWYRRAARWYVPGAPHVGDAYDRLEAIAREAEQRGDVPTALDAWRGIRSSILATRSVYTPHADRLEPANRRIAALMAQIDTADPEASEAQREAWHYALLERDDSPSVAWSVIALIGLAMWLGGAVLFAFRAVTSDDRLVPRVAARAGVLIAVGLVVWMVGLYEA